MASLSFRSKIILRVIVLGFILFSFIFALMQKELYVTSFFFFTLSVISLVELIYFLERWNREFNSLLLSIKKRDFSNAYPSLSNTSGEFRRAFDELILAYQEIKIEKELHYQYLQRLMENIRVAVICFEETGAAISFNSLAKELLGISSIRDIQSIAGISPELCQAITRISSSSGELISVTIGGEILQLSVHGSRFKLMDKEYLLVSLQNIRHELDDQELESWKKLIRVLTHEIMNSVTPISSLSNSLNSMLKDETGRAKTIPAFQTDDLEDLRCGLNTIETRSKGLLEFVNNYKKLTKLPTPVFAEFRAAEVIQTIQKLMEPRLLSQKVVLTIEESDPAMTIFADRGMIEQVMINLVTNSMDALSGIAKPQIKIRIYSGKGKKKIEVHDNGMGIPHENLKDIFIPFFSTKESGSGIGLSLSRQIMSLHGGTLTVRSEPGSGVVFILEFIL